MKKTIYFILFIYISSCKCLKPNNKAQEDYLFHIKKIENLFEGHKTSDLDKSVLFLEGLTGVMSEVNNGIEILYEPTKQNLRDWKKWYNRNKDKLYWDEKEQKVKLRQ